MADTNTQDQVLLCSYCRQPVRKPIRVTNGKSYVYCSPDHLIKHWTEIRDYKPTSLFE